MVARSATPILLTAVSYAVPSALIAAQPTYFYTATLASPLSNRFSGKAHLGFRFVLYVPVTSCCLGFHSLSVRNSRQADQTHSSSYCLGYLKLRTWLDALLEQEDTMHVRGIRLNPSIEPCSSVRLRHLRPYIFRSCKHPLLCNADQESQLLQALTLFGAKFEQFLKALPLTSYIDRLILPVPFKFLSTEDRQKLTVWITGLPLNFDS